MHILHKPCKIKGSRDFQTYVSCNGGITLDYFEMYKDVWAYHKKYVAGICESDEYWQKVVNESDDLLRKYKGCRFMRNLLLNEIDELDRLYKEMKANANAEV